MHPIWTDPQVYATRMRELEKITLEGFTNDMEECSLHHAQCVFVKTVKMTANPMKSG